MISVFSAKLQRALINNPLGFNSTSVAFQVKNSTYLYIGLYLQGVTHVSLRILGTQNVYLHTDFANSTTCVIDPDTPDYSLSLPRSLGSTHIGVGTIS